MTAEGTTASSPEELVVSLEQANALIDLDAGQWTHERWPRRLRWPHQ